MLKSSEQTNRSLHVLAIVTTVFLPASLVAGIFGMHVGGVPLINKPSALVWAMVIIAITLAARLLAVEALRHGRSVTSRGAAELTRDEARGERVEQKQDAQDRRLHHGALAPLPRRQRSPRRPLRVTGSAQARIRLRQVLAASWIVLPVGVSTVPSTTRVTLMPVPFTSLRSASVKPAERAARRYRRGIRPDEIRGRRGDASDGAAPAGEHVGQEGAGEVEGGKIRHLDHGSASSAVVLTSGSQRPAPALLMSTSGVPTSRAILALVSSMAFASARSMG